MVKSTKKSVESSKKTNSFVKKPISENSGLKLRLVRKPARPVNGNNGRRNGKITDYFPIRRSERMPSNVRKKLESLELERRIVVGDESHLQVRRFEGKGRGVVSRLPLKRGDFVVEYKGDLIERHQALQRDKEYAEKVDDVGCYMYFFEHNGKRYCVDATAETPYLGRLLNHSAKQPNCYTKVVEIERIPRLILLALKDIEPDVELLYNYGERDKEVIAANPWLVTS